jgi:hypothetical protein
MKKIIVIVLMCLAASVLPDRTFGQFNLGVKLGYNASKLSTNVDSVKSNFKSGFQFGAFARIGRKLYLQPELYYTTQGGVFTSNTQDWKQTIRIGSMDVPVLVGLKLINTDLVNLRVMAGPVASFTVNKSIEEGGLSTGPLTTGDLKSVNWALHAGLGVDVWLLTLDVRYQVGLSEIISEVQNYQFYSKNNAWVVSLGFKIL